MCVLLLLWLLSCCRHACVAVADIHVCVADIHVCVAVTMCCCSWLVCVIAAVMYVLLLLCIAVADLYVLLLLLCMCCCHIYVLLLLTGMCCCTMWWESWKGWRGHGGTWKEAWAVCLRPSLTVLRIMVLNSFVIKWVSCSDRWLKGLFCVSLSIPTWVASGVMKMFLAEFNWSVSFSATFFQNAGNDTLIVAT